MWPRARSLMVLLLLFGQLPMADGDRFLSPVPLSDAADTSTTSGASDTSTTSGASTSTSTSGDGVRVRDVVHPERLQPWWLLVLCNNVFFVVQKMAMGFDLKFSKPGRCSKYTAPFGPVRSVAFTFMALCVWRNDLIVICGLPAEAGTSQKVLLILIIYVMSPNFRSAKSFFTGLELQSPVALLNPFPSDELSVCGCARACLASIFMLRSNSGPLKAQYATIPLMDVPLLPWSARWFPWHKWIYMCVLLPYILPARLLSWLEVVVTLCWPGTHCAMVAAACSMLGHNCCCCLSLILVAITLGLWHNANQDLSARWQVSWPLLAVGALTMWSLVIPILVVRFYTNFLYRHSLDVYPSISLQGFRDLLGEREVWEAGRHRLVELQKDLQGERMERDFGPNWADELQTEASSEDIRAIGLQALKVRVVFETLIQMTTIPMTQLVLIQAARFYNGPMDLDNFVRAAKITWSERTVTQYTQYVVEKVSSTTAELSLKATILWNLL